MNDWTIDEPCEAERKAAERVNREILLLPKDLELRELDAALALIAEMREEHVRQRATIIMRNETIQQWRERARGIMAIYQGKARRDKLRGPMLGLVRDIAGPEGTDADA